MFQIEGKLPIIGRDDDKVKINVSKHGIKVIDVKGQVSGYVVSMHVAPYSGSNRIVYFLPFLK